MSRLDDLRKPSIAVLRAEAFEAWRKRHEGEVALPDRDFWVEMADRICAKKEDTLRRKIAGVAAREREHEESHGKGWGSIGLPGPIPVDAGESALTVGEMMENARRAYVPTQFQDGDQQFEVWSEGYSATGDRASARLWGRETGKDFSDAATKLVYATVDPKEWHNYRVSDGVPSFWGCRMYDNEADARRAFG